MIHIILGTKAQLVKMTPVMACLNESRLPYNFIFTGQHRATTREMLEEFELKKPDVILYHGDDVISIWEMARWMVRILWRSISDRQRIFQGDRQGIVIVHGDTFSTLLGAFMGRLAGLRVGHVEAGLRSRNIFHPFPEELTRLATLRLSHILFCPGSWATANVRHLAGQPIDTRANTLVDALRMALERDRCRDHVPQEPYGLVSIHRYENIFKRRTFELIVEHLQRIARRRKLLFILHPPTERRLREYGLHARVTEGGRIELRPRYTYCDFVSLLEKAEFVITDGGSIQEELSYLGIPCLLMRKATERQEGLGKNVLLSDYDPKIVEEFMNNLDQYRSQPDLESDSPSRIIVNSITPYA